MLCLLAHARSYTHTPDPSFFGGETQTSARVEVVRERGLILAFKKVEGSIPGLEVFFVNTYFHFYRDIFYLIFMNYKHDKMIKSGKKWIRTQKF